MGYRVTVWVMVCLLASLQVQFGRHFKVCMAVLCISSTEGTLYSAAYTMHCMKYSDLYLCVVHCCNRGMKNWFTAK